VAARAAAARMKRWTRVNLLLAVLAGILLALELWPAATPGQRVLTDLALEAVADLRIERADRLEIALRRDAAGWRLLHPHEAAALPGRVEQLLAIARAPVQRSYPAHADLAQYGLDHPQAVLQLGATRLAFGDRDPSQQLRYVLADGEVRVIDDVYFNLLTLPARHFTGG